LREWDLRSNEVYFWRQEMADSGRSRKETVSLASQKCVVDHTQQSRLGAAKDPMAALSPREEAVTAVPPLKKLKKWSRSELG
jgi:hypothetical protein